MDNSDANGLAWIFIGTTTFVILSLIYEFIRWACGLLFNKARRDAAADSPVEAGDDAAARDS